jgi:hypothetical protein
LRGAVDQIVVATPFGDHSLNIHIFNSVAMEDDEDMMEMYDGSTESDEDRFLSPLGESYDALVSVPPSFFRTG